MPALVHTADISEVPRMVCLGPFMPARFVWFRAAVTAAFPFLAPALAMAVEKP